MCDVLACFDSDSSACVGQGAGDAGEVELVGFLFRHFQQELLNLTDIAGDPGETKTVPVSGEFVLLGLASG